MPVEILVQQSKQQSAWDDNLDVAPLTVTVTTRIITLLVGNPYKPSFTTVTVRGPYPDDIVLF